MNYPPLPTFNYGWDTLAGGTAGTALVMVSHHR